ncbi:putative Afi1 domain-containing protein [Trypanosoma theileri]|uniref:Putative Afi1 domain-containing protein n=1 Tax=Trypanosoma theileri TaxID=67003 RepID=A0A1X0P690_9TRYP|nr:putative Afi1 domain-containing protein [Trypanosoma theileri]ORC92079.1 putative Afi1 domain-containing protein [Trypanosoma theileri]
MPIVDAISCDLCGALVALNKGKRVGSDTYRCSSCLGSNNNLNLTSFPTLNAVSPLTPKWIEAIGVVSFNLELGQTLTHLYPPLPFSLQQETDLAFLSFPDTNSTRQGKYLHHFVFPVDKNKCDKTRVEVSRVSSESSSSTGAKVLGRSSVSKLEVYHEEYFCSSFYRQRKDPNNLRGVQQKAIVLLSLYPFPRIFESMLDIICNEVLDSDNTEKMLGSAYDDISSWPFPLPTKRYKGLHLLGKPLGEFSTPYYTSLLCGPRWRDDELSRESKWCTTRRKLLESLERTHRDVQVIQRCLDDCILGSNPIEGLEYYIKENLKLSLNVASWKSCDFLTVNEMVRMRSYESCISKKKIDIFNFNELDDSINCDVSEIARHFRHIHYVSHDIAAIQNAELDYCRKLAEYLLHNSKDSAEMLDDSKSVNIFSEFDIHATLFPHLNRLWKIWELLITGEPLCVVGSSVGHVSAACLCLCSLLAPLSFTGVLRPYVTINNSEIDCLTPNEACHLPVLIGATNPFFVRHWMEWPHFLVLGTPGDVELQTHKTLPKSTPKREKLQFDMKTNMFTSKHFLIKSEKHVWDGITAEPFSINFFVSPSLKTIVNKVGEPANYSKEIRQTFLKLTKQFLYPLDRVVEIKFIEGLPSVFYSDNILPKSLIFAALEQTSNEDLPLYMFKQRIDMFEVYRKFMETATYRCWLKEKIFSLKRAVVIQSNSLESLLLVEPDPSRRYEVIMSLQYMLDCELRKPLMDVVLVQKLLELTSYFKSLRAILSR